MARKSKLNRPRRIRKGEAGYGKKKFVVNVRGKKGNVKTVRFGSASMEIKRDSAARRRNFRARHRCASATDKTTPRYWSCKFWEKGRTVSSLTRRKK